MALITALSIAETDSWAHTNGSTTKGRGQAAANQTDIGWPPWISRQYSLLRANERARLSDVQNDAAVYFAFSQSTENFIDGIEGSCSIVALTLPSAAKPSASSRSFLVPTIDPRRV